MSQINYHIEIVKAKFQQNIVIEETECQSMNPEGFLFKETFENNYCYLRLRPNGIIELSLFKSDYSQFEKIESDYLQLAIDFKIHDIEQTRSIITALF